MNPPPKTIPEELLARYTLDGQIPVIEKYRYDIIKPGDALVYSEEDIEALVAKAERRERNYYGCDYGLYLALDAHPIKGMNVAVLGSRIPWYEAVCIQRDGKPFTIEYNNVEYHHPKITTLTVDSPALVDLPPFDAALSISSFEHDGLGRYGDPLDPDGDIRAMRETWDMLKPGALLYLAVPVGKDCILWTGGRIYGPLRLPMLLEGWEQLDVMGGVHFTRPLGQAYQPVFVLRRTD